MSDLRRKLKGYHYIWNTTEGEEMFNELRVAWGTKNILHESPQHMGFNAGLLEAFRQIEFWKNGEGLDE